MYAFDSLPANGQIDTDLNGQDHENSAIREKCIASNHLFSVELIVSGRLKMSMVAPVYAHIEDELFLDVRQIVGEALQLGFRLEDLQPETPLVGNLPELDSMAVVTVIAALEEYFGFIVDDDDDVSHAFDTMGNLTRYVEAKIHNSIN